MPPVSSLTFNQRSDPRGSLLRIQGLPRWQEWWRIRLLMQETQKMQVWSLAWEDPWRRKWQAAPVFSPGRFHGQRSLEGYTVHGSAESRTWLSTHTSFISLLFSLSSPSVRPSMWSTLMISILGSPLQLFALSLPHPLPRCSNYITSCSDILRGFPLTTEMKPHPLAGIQGPLCSDHATLLSHNALPILKWDNISMWTTLTFTKDCQAAVGSVCCFNIFKAHLE